MVLHRDFIMRQIQQAVQVLLQALTSVLRLKSEERYDAAVQRITDVFGQIDLTPRPVGELDADELVELCTTSGGFLADLALSMADLLREQGEIFRLQEKHQPACESDKKALALYRKAITTEGAAMPMDIHARMTDLESRIEEHCR